MRDQNAPITVIVTGPQHTGKTIILSIIHKALIDAGYNNLFLENCESTPDVFLEFKSILNNPDGDVVVQDTLKAHPIHLAESFTPEKLQAVLDTQIETGLV